VLPDDDKDLEIAIIPHPRKLKNTAMNR